MSTPEVGSEQWKRNEKIIAQDPVLRRARDTSEGFTKSSTIVSHTPTDAYRAGWDRIFGDKS